MSGEGSVMPLESFHFAHLLCHTFDVKQTQGKYCILAKCGEVCQRAKIPSVALLLPPVHCI